nr:MAG TPA: hypothetical protein [Caudoviricetes sp.]
MELQTFNFDHSPVRTFVDEHGEWFCGRDDRRFNNGTTDFQLRSQPRPHIRR